MKVFRSPRVWMAACLAVGWFAASYLLFEYVTGGPIVCGATAGCEIVRASRWAYIGPIPLPLFGVAFYSSMLFLLVLRSVSFWRPDILRRLTFIGAAIGFVESAYLFLVQWLSIGAFCLWCLTSATAATTTFVLSWADRGPIAEDRRLLDLYGYVGVFIALAVLGAAGFVMLVR